MNRDIKFLLGLVPWGVTFALFFIGAKGYLPLWCGLGLAVLYVVVAVLKKFYKDPPKHVLHAYSDVFGMNAWFLVGWFFGELVPGSLATPLSVSISGDWVWLLRGAIYGGVVLFELGLIFSEPGGPVRVAGVSVSVMRRLSVYFLMATLAWLIICLEFLYLTDFLVLPLLFWGSDVLRYLIIRLFA